MTWLFPPSSLSLFFKCTAVCDVGCVSAVHYFGRHVVTERDVLLSLRWQCKQTCLLLWDICCSPQLEPKQRGVGWGGKPTEHTHTPAPGSRTRTIGGFLSKQEARVGPKRLQQQEDPSLFTSTYSPVRRQKTGRSVTGMTQNTSLPASLGRRGAAAAGLH